MPRPYARPVRSLTRRGKRYRLSCIRPPARKRARVVRKAKLAVSLVASQEQDKAKAVAAKKKVRSSTQKSLTRRNREAQAHYPKQGPAFAWAVQQRNLRGREQSPSSIYR